MDIKYSNVIIGEFAEEQLIHFPMAYRNFSVTNFGDTDTYISLRPDISQRLSSSTGLYEDIIIIPSGSTAIIDANQMDIYVYQAKRVQISGTTDSKPRICAAIGSTSSSPVDPPGPIPPDTSDYLLSGFIYVDAVPLDDTAFGDTLYEEAS